MSVWVLEMGDTGCDDPGYISWTEVFLTREGAQRGLKDVVSDDTASLGIEPQWNDGHTWALFECADGRMVVYQINEKVVRI